MSDIPRISPTANVPAIRPIRPTRAPERDPRRPRRERRESEEDEEPPAAPPDAEAPATDDDRGDDAPGPGGVDLRV